MEGIATLLGVFAGVAFGVVLGIKLSAHGLGLDLVDVSVLIVTKILGRSEE